MADGNRAASFAKNIQKRAGRAKELFSQKLGRADRTTDEGFEEYVRNFNSQQFAATRLSKEIRNYNSCVKALQVASKSLMDLLSDLYEPNWVDHDKIQVQAELLEKKWDDYHTTIDDQVVKPLVSYSEQFPDVNTKIMKRSRKLLDYDCCRHTIQSLEQASKKKEETKLAKAKEQLSEKQQLYETINFELMVELPALWDSRVSFLASNFQCLFLAEATFHSDTSKIFQDLNDAVEMLAAENQKGSYAIKRYSATLSMPAVYPTEMSASCDEPFAQESSSNEYLSTDGVLNSSRSSGDSDTKTVQKELESDMNNKFEMKEEDPHPVNSNCSEKKDVKRKDDDDMTKKELPSGVLYQVKATHQYVAEDGDELTFEPGEIINVTEFDDPDQQEEGWLMGYREGNSIKGLFPANFTTRIEQ